MPEPSHAVMPDISSLAVPLPDRVPLDARPGKRGRIGRRLELDLELGLEISISTLGVKHSPDSVKASRGEKLARGLSLEAKFYKFQNRWTFFFQTT
jgi:hypothetical protein